MLEQGGGNGAPVDPFPSGVIYRNPKPHVSAVHAWHPTLISLGHERLLATFDLGQAVEGLDYGTYSSFSNDGGETWSQPTPLFSDPHPRRSTHTIRPARLADGRLVAVGGRHFRDDAKEGICNRANMGHVEMELFLLRSDDEGKSWRGPERFVPPLIGPAFEVAHGIVESPDGRWLWPTSTWKGWNGDAPNGMKAVALVSYDRGQSWSEYIDIFDGQLERIIHFEQSLVVLCDQRLLACAWCSTRLPAALATWCTRFLKTAASSVRRAALACRLKPASWSPCRMVVRPASSGVWIKADWVRPRFPLWRINGAPNDVSRPGKDHPPRCWASAMPPTN